MNIKYTIYTNMNEQAKKIYIILLCIFTKFFCYHLKGINYIVETDTISLKSFTFNQGRHGQ